VHVPVLMHLQGLLEAGAFLAGLGLMSLQQPGGLEDAVDAGGDTGDDVRIEHHEGEPAVALQREAVVEGKDGLLLLLVQPVVAWDPGVVLVGLAVAVLPGVPLGSGQAEPKEEGEHGDAGFVGPLLDEINEGIAGVVGNPETFQGSPSSFFSWTCSSISSARTSF